jgi:hypothetical protein
MLHSVQVVYAKAMSSILLQDFSASFSHFPFSTISSKYIKLVEIVVIQVLGFVENERTFSTISFIESRLQNQLSTHLNIFIRFYSQLFFILQNFPYDQAIAKWQGKV